jgi:hypothetical protein
MDESGQNPVRPEDIPRVPPIDAEALIAAHVPFQDRPGALMDLIRLAATDWPAAEQQLIDFKYAPPWKATIPFAQPGWYDEVEDSPTLPDTWQELQMATAYGMLTCDQFNAVADARWTRDHPYWQPGDVFAPDGRSGYQDKETGEFVERTGAPESADSLAERRSSPLKVPALLANATGC